MIHIKRGDISMCAYDKLLKLLDDLKKTKIDNYDNLKVSSIDNGYIQSCIEMKEVSLAIIFLKDIYKMNFKDAIIHISRVMRKSVPIS